MTLAAFRDELEKIAKGNLLARGMKGISAAYAPTAKIPMWSERLGKKILTHPSGAGAIHRENLALKELKNGMSAEKLMKMLG